MKKIAALLLAAIMVFALVACGETKPAETKTAEVTKTAAETKTAEATEDNADVMSYDEFLAAEEGEIVTVETYVQAKQSWWEEKASVYLQDAEGAYFVYNMTCSEEDFAKLNEGTCIRVTGPKVVFNGLVEIAPSGETLPTFEIVEGAEFVAEPADVTDVFGTEEINDYMSRKITVKGATVEAANEKGDAFMYKWNGTGEKGDDLYYKVSLHGATFTFVVESYLCGQETDVYKAVEGLKVGDKIDITGFLYWYEGPQPHTTAITVAD